MYIIQTLAAQMVDYNVMCPELYSKKNNITAYFTIHHLNLYKQSYYVCTNYIIKKGN